MHRGELISTPSPSPPPTLHSPSHAVQGLLVLELEIWQDLGFREEKEGKLAKPQKLWFGERSRGIQGVRGAGSEGLRAPPASQAHSHTCTDLPPCSPCPLRPPCKAGATWIQLAS
jgi:hypothetical protein